MKKYLVLALCLLMVTIGHAQNYTEYFADKTLRIDYIFTGNAVRQHKVREVPASSRKKVDFPAP